MSKSKLSRGEHGNARRWSSMSVGHSWSAAWFWDLGPIDENELMLQEVWVA